MMFERVAPSCYPYDLFPVLLEQSASVSPAPDQVPVEHVHCAVLKINQVYAEIRETVERIASPPRKLRLGNKADRKKADGKTADGKIVDGKLADGKIADGMSAGG
jgi:hypothetical protein